METHLSARYNALLANAGNIGVKGKAVFSCNYLETKIPPASCRGNFIDINMMNDYLLANWKKRRPGVISSCLIHQHPVYRTS
jgi:hypothetical protein